MSLGVSLALLAMTSVVFASSPFAQFDSLADGDLVKLDFTVKSWPLDEV